MTQAALDLKAFEPLLQQGFSLRLSYKPSLRPYTVVVMHGYFAVSRSASASSYQDAVMQALAKLAAKCAAPAGGAS